MVDIDPTHSPDPGDPDVDFEPEHDEPDLDESGDDPDEGEEQEGATNAYSYPGLHIYYFRI